MSEIDDGGYLFPSPDSHRMPDGHFVPSHGATMRDYFAAHAHPLGSDTPIEYAASAFGIEPLHSDATAREHSDFWADVDAAHRFRQADAMIRARGRK